MKKTKRKCSAKKILLSICAVLMALVIVATVAGPYILLECAKQPEVEDSYSYSESFAVSYDEVRENLRNLTKKLNEKGIKTETSEFAIDEADGLYIDSIFLPAEKDKTNLIVLTTGVHGMEGFIGAVMLDVFFEEIYPGIDTSDTGILVVANINPYGMKYLRRYNENNVDLNRNFILDWDNFDLSSNKDYPEVQSFLEPEGAIGNAFWHEAEFYLSLAKEAITKGASKVSDALLSGQYESASGVYYGGTGDEKSTAYLKGVFNDCLDGDYENIVHIDIHSGYGPRYNMVIFNSVYETMTEAETKKLFGYDYIISHDSESFYATTGDTTDYFYRLAEQKNSEKGLFSTCFEFGTIGDSFIDSILSLKYTVDENRQHRFPTENKISAEIVHQNYLELFYPTETSWREKTVEDFIAAATGVLSSKLK